MSKRFGFAAAALALALLAAPAAAQTTPAERTAIEGIVHDYLMAHPEVIEDAVTALRDRREKEAAATQSRTIAENRAQIFDSANQMVLGNPQGKVTLVEFFDYNCGYCKRAVSDLVALIEANPDLRVVMKEFPILSPGSVEAARISVAVKDMAPQKYFAFHQQVFSRPGEASSAKALEVARGLGLDTKALTAAANRDDVTKNLQEVHQIAEALGIGGTPSYVVGNEFVPGAAGFDALQQLVTSMGKCGAATC